MKKVVDWVKKYGWMVLVGIGGILAAILGVKYEREKIAALKREVSIAKVKGDIKVEEYKKDEAKKADVELEKKDSSIGDKIKEDKDAIQDARESAKDITGDAISDYINSRYGK